MQEIHRDYNSFRDSLGKLHTTVDNPDCLSTGRVIHGLNEIMDVLEESQVNGKTYILTRGDVCAINGVLQEIMLCAKYIDDYFQHAEECRKHGQEMLGGVLALGLALADERDKNTKLKA